MTAALELDDTANSGLITGRLLARDGAQLLIAVEDARFRGTPGRGLRGTREVRARQAASCLLAPEVGDRVLVAVLPEPYVLAVLDRGERPVELVLEGDAAIRATGKLDLAGNGGVSLTTPEAVSVTAGTFSAVATEGKLIFKSLKSVARIATTHFDSFEAVTRTANVIAERVASRVKRAFRTVEETDQLRARHLDYRAEQTAQLHGETTVVTADQVARIDGAQVMIG
jgi:hypothetical protein